MNDKTMSPEMFRAPARSPVAAEAGIAGVGHPVPGVSWAAVLAGAVGAAALSLILLILGIGLGLSSVSPWAAQGVSAESFGTSTILWLAFTQLAASGMGGYLAGRLRTRWATLHVDEVYFRDTAHGFLAWSVATLATASLLSSAIGTIVSAGTQVGASAIGGAATAVSASVPAASRAAARPDQPDRTSYFVDSLFRSTGDTAPAVAAGDGNRSSTEVGRIFATSMSNGSMTAEDTKYVGQMVAQRTGLAPADAERRVADTFSKANAAVTGAAVAAKDAADKARKSSAYAALWLFVSLLVGAFVASFAATFGGRRRDQF